MPNPTTTLVCDPFTATVYGDAPLVGVKFADFGNGIAFDTWQPGLRTIAGKSWSQLILDESGIDFYQSHHMQQGGKYPSVGAWVTDQINVAKECVKRGITFGIHVGGGTRGGRFAGWPLSGHDNSFGANADNVDSFPRNVAEGASSGGGDGINAPGTDGYANHESSSSAIALVVLAHITAIQAALGGVSVAAAIAYVSDIEFDNEPAGMDNPANENLWFKKSVTIGGVNYPIDPDGINAERFAANMHRLYVNACLAGVGSGDRPALLSKMAGKAYADGFGSVYQPGEMDDFLDGHQDWWHGAFGNGQNIPYMGFHSFHGYGGAGGVGGSATNIANKDAAWRQSVINPWFWDGGIGYDQNRSGALVAIREIRRRMNLKPGGSAVPLSMSECWAWNTANNAEAAFGDILQFLPVLQASDSNIGLWTDWACNCHTQMTALAADNNPNSQGPLDNNGYPQGRDLMFGITTNFKMAVTGRYYVLAEMLTKFNRAGIRHMMPIAKSSPSGTIPQTPNRVTLDAFRSTIANSGIDAIQAATGISADGSKMGWLIANMHASQTHDVVVNYVRPASGSVAGRFLPNNIALNTSTTPVTFAAQSDTGFSYTLPPLTAIYVEVPLVGGPPPPPPATAPVNQTAPSVSGVATQGQVLNVNVGTWVPTPTGYTYQWRRCDASGASCSNITGATGPSYTLQAGDVGSTIRVVVTASNQAGSNNATSAQTGVVAAVSATNLAPNPGFETDPNVDYYTNGSGTFTWASDQAHGGAKSVKVVSAVGTTTRWMSQIPKIPVVGGTRYAVQAYLRIAAAAGANVTVSFWKSDQSYQGTSISSSDIAGTADWQQVGLEAVAPSDAAYMRVEFRLNGAGTLWADDVSVVVGTIAAAPTNTVAPSITGSAVRDQVLQANVGQWDGNPTSYGYVWKRDGGAIGGATASSYTLVTADVGHVVTVTVTATNGTGSASATSAPTATVTAPAPPVVAPANTGAPAISGTPVRDQRLQSSQGTWDNNPASLAYQWNRAGAPIAAATHPFYDLVAADVGHTITVTVTATNSAGSANATSAATASITAPTTTPKAATVTDNFNDNATGAIWQKYEAAPFTISEAGAKLVLAGGTPRWQWWQVMADADLEGKYLGILRDNVTGYVHAYYSAANGNPSQVGGVINVALNDPLWLKLEEAAGTVTFSHATDAATWTPFGTIATPSWVDLVQIRVGGGNDAGWAEYQLVGRVDLTGSHCFVELLSTTQFDNLGLAVLPRRPVGSVGGPRFSGGGYRTYSG